MLKYKWRSTRNSGSFVFNNGLSIGWVRASFNEITLPANTLVNSVAQVTSPIAITNINNHICLARNQIAYYCTSSWYSNVATIQIQIFNCSSSSHKISKTDVLFITW